MTIAEVARVLKPGGRFVNVSRSNVASRSFDLFEPFGFTESEMVEVCRAARLYSDTQGLIDECAKHGLALEETYTFQSDRERIRDTLIAAFIRQ